MKQKTCAELQIPHSNPQTIYTIQECDQS